MTPALDQRAHVAALDALLTPVLAGRPIYDYGKVPGLDGNPGTIPVSYVLRSVERVYEPMMMLDGDELKGRWRATIRCVDTTLTNARLLNFVVSQVLGKARLSIDGHESTPVTFEQQNEDEPKNGRCSLLTLWTYEVA